MRGDLYQYIKTRNNNIEQGPIDMIMLERRTIPHLEDKN